MITHPVQIGFEIQLQSILSEITRISKSTDRSSIFRGGQTNTVGDYFPNIISYSLTSYHTKNEQLRSHTIPHES